MIISHLELAKPIELSEQQPTILVIENASLFRRWVQMLSFQCEGDTGEFLLSHDNDDRSFEKHAIIIRDPLLSQEIEEKISRSLLKRLEQLARNEYIAETQKLEMALLSYAEKLGEGLSISLDHSDSIDVKALVKILRFTPEWEEELLARLCGQMRLAQEFLHTELFIFIGCKAYFNSEELLQLYHEFTLHHARLLLIEPVQRDILEGEHTIIIDQDLCELRFSC